MVNSQAEIGTDAVPAPEAGGSILIVDDSPTQLEVLRFLLEGAGYTVTTAADGHQALMSVEQALPDLIISDIVMPVMDGYELCAAIKRNPRFAHIPIILLTRLGDVEDIIIGLQAQADYYVTKPFNAEFLLSRVKMLLDKEQWATGTNNQQEIEVTLAGKSYVVSAERRQMLNLLVSTYDNAMQKHRDLLTVQNELKIANSRLIEQTHIAQISERNYLQVLQNNLDAMVVVDQDSKIKFLNSSALTLWNRTEPELIGTPLELPLTTGLATETTIKRIGKPDALVELRVVETVWAGARAYLVTLRDITERKEYEVRFQQQQQQLRETNTQLQMLASMDPITGLSNFRAFKERLDIEFSRAQRYNTLLSLLLLDLDRFKSFNDAFGHLAGDEALRAVADVLRHSVRDSDYPARYGGEEFIVLLPNTDATGAVNSAERLRQALASNEWRLRPVTASFGAATLAPSMHDSVMLLEAADRAMYQSKFTGRNRVTHAHDVEDTLLSPPGDDA